MSGGGGGNKRKPTKTQGWEEAGAEFYQESYPTDAEFDAIQKDPKHLATLLPSKKNRAVATIRIRTNDNRTVRRQTSSRSRRESTVHRRASTTADVQVSMLPDLSENLSNEQTTWEEIMQIKAMPVPMAQKKEMKAKILNEPNLRLQGYEQFKWKRRKIWRQFLSYFKEINGKLELYKGTLKRIEGHFGTGVVAYFLFLKYLLFLNLFIFLLIFFFIVLPTIILNNFECPRLLNETDNNNVALDLFQGTNFMRYIFYQCFPNETFHYYTINGSDMYYNLPLAYVCVTLLYFFISLLAIVKAAANGFKERLVESEGQFYQYCNIIFGGWDFCIHNDKSAAIKHQAIFNELNGCLQLEKRKEIIQSRTRNEKIKLFFIRVIVNLISLVILGGCGVGIYYVFDFSNTEEENQSNDVLKFILEYLPSMCIVSMNILVPFIFRFLITYEDFSPTYEVRVTLARTVLLRLASIFTLYASLSQEIEKRPCWETFIGQQIYKLVLTDFATHLLLTFFINFPRSLLADHVKNNFVKFLGAQSFDLPKHVLDVVYTQTLCWVGCFYAPLLSFIFLIICFFMFHIKKFACLVNSSPSSTIYRASRSHSMFMIVLLISFISAIIPLAISFSDFKPSDDCGPFTNTPSVWYTIQSLFDPTPKWLRDIIDFLSTAGFLIPTFLLLFLLLYYYRAINSANRYMVSVLKNQLVMEGHDKQFLLERLSKFIKQQQEHQKRLRHVDVLQDGDTNISSN